MYQPNFLITVDINNRIAELERIRGIVQKSRILPQQEIVLRLRAKIDAVHSSTSIEGNLLNKSEVKKVLSGKTVRNANERMVIEAINYKQALDWLEKRLNESKKIKVEDILKLHYLTMKNLLPDKKVGRFRQGPIYIIDVIKHQEIIRYVGPKSELLDKIIKELLDWLENDGKKLHPILAAGLLHYQFVSIHPFSDGNGRVTRLLTLLYLWLNRYDYRKVLVPDVYYWQHRLDYYDALNRAKTYKGRRLADLTPWLNFFTKGFLESAKDLEKEIVSVSVSGRNSGEIIRLSPDELIMVDFVKQMGRVDLKDMLLVLDLPSRTVQRRLKGLVEKNIFKRFGQGPAVFYQLVK